MQKRKKERKENPDVEPAETSDDSVMSFFPSQFKHALA
jgi:hypothetical protein